MRLLLVCVVGRSMMVLIGPTVALRAILSAQTLLLIAIACAMDPVLLIPRKWARLSVVQSG